MNAATTKWQDWASFALGLWLAVSPWIAGYAEHEAATGERGRSSASRSRSAAHFEACLDERAGRNGSTSRRACGWCARRSCSASARRTWPPRTRIAVGASSRCSRPPPCRSTRKSASCWHKRSPASHKPLRQALCGNLPRHVHGHRAGGREDRARCSPLEIDCGGLDLADVAVGDSICVQGVCLTVTAHNARADLPPTCRTKPCASPPAWTRPGEVNLEKSLAPRRQARRAPGHRPRRRRGRGRRRARAASSHSARRKALARYVAAKGSICVDGVSLTVNRVEGERVRGQPDPAHPAGDDARRASRRARRSTSRSTWSRATWSACSESSAG